MRTRAGVHELDLVVRPDGTALALGATPFADYGWLYFGAPRSGEVQIVDITEPEDPARLSTWSVFEDSDLESVGGDPFVSTFQGSGSFTAVFAHSVRAADDGDSAYVSYWDAGIVKLDISDPSDPTIVGRTQFGPGEDGDAHSMFPLDVGGTRYVLQNDEDYDPASPSRAKASVTSRWVNGLDMPWMPQTLADTEEITGDVIDAGEGCSGDDYAGAAGKIVVADTIDFYYTGVIDAWPEAPCRLKKQTKLAARSGATALVSNFISPDDPWPWPFRRPDGINENEDMVVFQVAAGDGLVQAIRDEEEPRRSRCAPPSLRWDTCVSSTSRRRLTPTATACPSSNRWGPSRDCPTSWGMPTLRAAASGRSTTRRSSVTVPTRRGTATGSSPSTCPIRRLHSSWVSSSQMEERSPGGWPSTPTRG